MLQDLDQDGALALLAAIARQWLKDARENPAELRDVATWLGLTPRELARRLDGRPALRPADPARWRTCPACGQTLPDHNASETGQGRRRLYCDDTCRRRAARARRNEV